MAHEHKPRMVFNIEMDDRTVLWPDGKFLTHVTVHEVDGRVRLDAVFMFNESRGDTLIADLDPDDAWELGRYLIEAVYQGRTQHVLSDTARIGVVFNPNGFVVRVGEGAALKELFLASPAIIRLAQGILRTLDAAAAPAAN
ncbi:MAG: hypothetical protein HQL40_13810 [Alphaproteobacteria bacterium]|nr:hypothetical protein [Alphaproteobacteria bacterium]